MKQEMAENLKVGDAFQDMRGWGKQPKPVWWVMGVYEGSVLAKAYVRCVHGTWIRTTKVFLMKALVARYTNVIRGMVIDALQVAERAAEDSCQT